MKSRVVYIVTGQRADSLGPRPRSLLRLRDRYDRVVLVTAGKQRADDHDLVIRPYPNPTAIFRVLKLPGIKRLIDSILFFPSTNILFVWAARSKLKVAIQRELSSGRDVCILTTIPPHPTSLIGLYLKKRFPKIRWIVDWRDLWTFDSYYLTRVPSLYRGGLARLEKKILESTDLNITTNPYAKRVLEDRYGVSPSRVVSIPHSFYPLDFPRSNRDNVRQIESPAKPIQVGFLGTLFKPPKVPGDKVLAAFLSARGKGLNVNLHVIGSVEDSFRELSKYRADDWLVLRGNLSHADALREIAALDLLLAVQEDLPNSRAMMHAKLVDYLLVGLPILAIVPTVSAVADVVRGIGNGYVIPAESDWGEGLAHVLEEWSRTRAAPRRNESVVQNYNWEQISKRWEQAIDGVLPAATDVSLAPVKGAAPDKTCQVE